jgi:outer membrane protein, heavy metal efflux system
VISFPFYSRRHIQPLLASLLCFTAGVAWAQTPDLPQAASPTLSRALDAAWQRSVASRTNASRLADLQAQRSSADRFFAGSPQLALALRTDRLNRNRGMREWEAEIEAPLQRLQVRQTQLGQLDAQQRALAPVQNAEKLKLALQLRELLAQARLAQVDVETARTKLDESSQLARDMERRLRAGDVARLDALQAQAAQAQGQAQLGAASAHLQQLLLQWQGLTSQTQWPQELQTPSAISSNSTDNASLERHPVLQVAQAQREIALSKLRASEADNRDPMAVALSITRERSAFGQSSEGALRLALRIPIGTDQRNAPRLSAARLELDIAEAELDTTLQSLQSELNLQESRLTSARAARDAADRRLAFVKEAHDLILHAWRLGERSLAERLRADGERFEAEQIASRSRIEVINAQASLQQAIGLLP